MYYNHVGTLLSLSSGIQVDEFDRLNGIVGGDIDASSAPISRELLITAANVQRARKRMVADATRLHGADGLSVALHVAQAEKGSILLYKPTDSAPPLHSGVRPNSFLLVWQTEWQAARLQKHRHQSIWFMDATHNTTRYLNMLLSSILVKDRHGRGTFSSFRTSGFCSYML